MQSQITMWSDALMASLSGAFAMFFLAVPRLIGFAVILIVGWIIASLIEKALVALLGVVHFNGFAERAGLSGFIRKVDQDNDASGMIGAIAKWFVRLIALMVAFDALGLPAVSSVLRELLMWLPNLVVALVALVIGGIAAHALGNVVHGAAVEGGLQKPELLARVARGAVWAFAIIVAVHQIGIATELVNTLFIAIVGAFALAAGLSFGLGGRDTAAAIIRNWYRRGQQDLSMPVVDAAGSQTNIFRTQVASGERRSAIADRRHGSGAAL